MCSQSCQRGQMPGSEKRNILVRKWLRAAAALFAVFLFAGIAVSQQGQGGQAGQGENQGMHRRGRGGPPDGRAGQRGTGFMQRLRDLSPDEQERVLANDQRFRNLPPARQARIRENLKRWNALSPEAKQRIRERQRAFARLSTGQREQARELSQKWRELPPLRRRLLRREFRRLRDLPPEKREAFLASPEIEKQLSSEDRDLLRGLAKLLPEGHEPESSPEP
jgi:Protein of unknown function (DUF3106)